MNFVLPLPKVAKANTQTKLLPSALCPFLKLQAHSEAPRNVREQILRSVAFET
jgi:hypothetical protein